MPWDKTCKPARVSQVLLLEGKNGSGIPRIFFFFGGGEGSTNSVEDRGKRERGSRGGSPYSGVPLNLQMSEPRILNKLLQMYFSTELEIRLSFAKTSEFGGGGGGWKPQTPPGTPQNTGGRDIFKNNV
jgi:hypothetical protein